MNFGPTFRYPPRKIKYRPVSILLLSIQRVLTVEYVQMSEAADVVAVEKLMSDMLYHVHARFVAARKPYS